MVQHYSQEVSVSISICLIRTSKWRTCNKATVCKKLDEIHVYEIQVNMIFHLLLIFIFVKKRNSITINSTRRENVNRFSSDLVHRHIFLLTLLLLEQLMIISPDITL